MEGPTPVCALIHAATMVTAGVYMVARSNAAVQSRRPTAMAVVAGVGALTALFAATIGLVQNDIKRVLAYSTISQLGYMFLACGVGAFGAGIFHLMTHAFFKALLFLGAGSVIHALAGEQDMRKMGGLRKQDPDHLLDLLVATLAIAGIPPFAGFFSKDEILLAGVRQTVGHAALGHRLDHRRADRLLHVPAGLPDVLRHFAGADHEVEHHVHESPEIDARAAAYPGGAFHHRRLVGWPDLLLGGATGWRDSWSRSLRTR